MTPILKNGFIWHNAFSQFGAYLLVFSLLAENGVPAQHDLD